MSFTNLGYALGDPVLMQYGKAGQLKVEHSGGVLGVIASCSDYMFTDDIPLGRDDFPFARAQPFNGRYFCVSIDVRTQLPCTLGQGLGDISRCDVAVIRVIDRTQ